MLTRRDAMVLVALTAPGQRNRTRSGGRFDGEQRCALRLRTLGRLARMIR